MDYILLYGRWISCKNFVYQMTLIYIIYTSIMTKVNVSTTVGEMSATVGECPRQWGEMSATVGGNVRNSREIEYALRYLRLEIVIHNFA